MGFVGEKKHQNGDFMGIASEFGFYPNLTWSASLEKVDVNGKRWDATHQVFVNKANLTGAKRREWMGCWGLLGVAGLIITSDDWDHSPKFDLHSLDNPKDLGDDSQTHLALESKKPFVKLVPPSSLQKVRTVTPHFFSWV